MKCKDNVKNNGSPLSQETVESNGKKTWIKYMQLNPEGA